MSNKKEIQIVLRFRDENGNDYPNWEEKKLGDIARVFDGTHQTPNYVDNGIPFYSVEQVTANNFKKTKFVSQEVFDKENKRVKIEKGDILMTRIGDIGTARLIDWDVNASFYVSLALIKCKEECNSVYLNQYIKTNEFQTELWNRTIHVAFPKKINLGEISHCKVLLPTIQEQNKIGKFLSSIDEKIEKLESELEELKSYKKGVMQAIFATEAASSEQRAASSEQRAASSEQRAATKD